MDSVTFETSNMQQFSAYVSQPEQITHNDSVYLESLADKYPYCQLLHYFIACAKKNEPDFPENLATAAAYATNREILHTLIHHPQSLGFKIKGEVATEETEHQSENKAIEKDENEHPFSKLDDEPQETATHHTEEDHQPQIIEISNTASAETTSPLDSLIEEAPITQADHDLAYAYEQKEAEYINAEADGQNEIKDQPDTDDDLQTETPEAEFVEAEADDLPPSLKEYDDDEVYEEIQEHFYLESEPIASVEKEEPQPQIETVDFNEPLTGVYHPSEKENDLNPQEDDWQQEKPEQEKANSHQEIETIMFENPVAGIYTPQFEETDKFDKKEPLKATEEPIKVEHEFTKAPIDFQHSATIDYFAFEKFSEPQKLLSAEKENVAANITPYHDEQMPYTFLWWLQKTRSEHAATYQPYQVDDTATQKEIKKNESDDELQHQIVEHIFQLQSAENISITPEIVSFDTNKKEDVLIKKFIVEAPHIKPPEPSKIDTENKAKKSSEESDELVSETLAKVYQDQMLYHKAIDTYKKLSLKYPEKSTYFASQIKYLELKIN